MKSRSNKFAGSLIFAAVLALLGAMACQKAQVVEYKKYSSDADVPRITLDDAKKEFDAHTTIIVDSRPEAQFKMEHIAGAINIPIGSTPDKFSALTPGKKVIVYCS